MLAYWICIVDGRFVYSDEFTEGTHIQRLWNNIKAFPSTKDDIVSIFIQEDEPVPGDSQLPCD